MLQYLLIGEYFGSDVWLFEMPCWIYWILFRLHLHCTAEISRFSDFWCCLRVSLVTVWVGSRHENSPADNCSQTTYPYTTINCVPLRPPICYFWFWLHFLDFVILHILLPSIAFSELCDTASTFEFDCINVILHMLPVFLILIAFSGPLWYCIYFWFRLHLHYCWNMTFQQLLMLSAGEFSDSLGRVPSQKLTRRQCLPLRPPICYFWFWLHFLDFVILHMLQVFLILIAFSGLLWYCIYCWLRLHFLNFVVLHIFLISIAFTLYCWNITFQQLLMLSAGEYSDGLGRVPSRKLTRRQLFPNYLSLYHHKLPPPPPWHLQYVTFDFDCIFWTFVILHILLTSIAKQKTKKNKNKKQKQTNTKKIKTKKQKSAEIWCFCDIAYIVEFDCIFWTLWYCIFFWLHFLDFCDTAYTVDFDCIFWALVILHILLSLIAKQKKNKNKKNCWNMFHCCSLASLKIFF